MPVDENYKKSKRWCFTVNNPGDWVPTFDVSMAFLCYQHEIGEQGTPHIQGYVRFTNSTRLVTAKNKLHTATGHLEKAWGSEEECAEYCRKEDTRAPGTEPVRLGNYDGSIKEQQGKRSDLEEAADMIVNGASMREVALAHKSDFIRYHMGFLALQETVAPPKPPIKENFSVLVLWGPTGTGKTYRARMNYPNAYVLPPGKSRDPWGQYSGQTTIIIDEFDPSNWELPVLNQVLDHYRFPLDARYRNKSADFEQVVICSNITPTTWYQDLSILNPMMFDALRRRLTGNCRLVSTRENQGGPSFEQITAEAPNPF